MRNDRYAQTETDKLTNKESEGGGRVRENTRVKTRHKDSDREAIHLVFSRYRTIPLATEQNEQWNNTISKRIIRLVTFFEKLYQVLNTTLISSFSP